MLSRHKNVAINPIFGNFYFEAMYIAKKEKNRCLYIYVDLRKGTTK